MKKVALITTNWHVFRLDVTCIYEGLIGDKSRLSAGRHIEIEYEGEKTAYYWVRHIDDVRGIGFDSYRLLPFAHDIENLSEVIEAIGLHIKPKTQID